MCPYHHWTYHTTGELRTATHFGGYRQHGHPELDPRAFGLRAIRSGVWHNWILVNLDGQAPPLEAFVAPLADYYRDVAFPRARHFSTVSRHPFPANWKTVTENNIEPYHVPMVHPGTTAGHPFDCHRTVDEGALVGCAVDIEGSTFTNRPPPQTADHLDGSGRFILRVPNLYIAAHAPDKLVDSLILPDWDDPLKCWVSHACYTTSEPGAGDGALGRWAAIQETVMEEDAAVMEGVVRGFRAPVMDDGGVISPRLGELRQRILPITARCTGEAGARLSSELEGCAPRTEPRPDPAPQGHFPLPGNLPCLTVLRGFPLSWNCP